MGLENRFQADDYSTAARFTYLGFFGALTDQLRVLNGRFVGYLVTDVFTLFGPRGAWISTWVVLLGLLVAVVFALPGSSAGWARRIALGTLATSAIVLAMPVPEQALLWIAGTGMVGVSLAFAIGSVAAARVASEASGRRRLVALTGAFILATAASGSYETTAVVLVLCSGLAIVAVGRRWTALVATMSVAGGAGFGLLIVALMPGSSSRKSDLANGMPARRSAEAAWDQAIEFSKHLPQLEPLWIVLVVGLVLAAPGVRWSTSVRWGVLAIVGGFGGLIALFALANWTLGAAPPGRTMTVATTLAVAFVFLIGWLVPLPKVLIGPAVVVALVVLVQVSLPRMDQIAPRASWASAWDRRDAHLRATPEDGVARVPTLASGAGLEDLSADRTSWVNGAAAIYYDVEAIEALPEPVVSASGP